MPKTLKKHFSTQQTALIDNLRKTCTYLKEERRFLLTHKLENIPKNEKQKPSKLTLLTNVKC